MKKLPWHDETLSIRKRLCLWLFTHNEAFTTEDARAALHIKKPTESRKDQVSQEISVLAFEEKLTRGFYRRTLRLYKKVEGFEFDEFVKRVNRREVLLKRAEKKSKHTAKLPPGIKGIIVHKLE